MNRTEIIMLWIVAGAAFGLGIGNAINVARLSLRLGSLVTAVGRLIIFWPKEIPTNEVGGTTPEEEVAQIVCEGCGMEMTYVGEVHDYLPAGETTPQLCGRGVKAPPEEQDDSCLVCGGDGGVGDYRCSACRGTGITPVEKPGGEAQEESNAPAD